MSAIRWEAQIAPVAGAIKIAGKDGTWRATFEGGPDSLTAMFALCAMIDAEGQAIILTAEPYTPPTYGRQIDGD